ncbi:STOM [Lepeophtheirus salmonis]|uniref:STOM n=1 Tax=Lepeophtheirus salmonis TaxID=72036 RepID=A0A7R8D2C4_LEPSM|nr:STOM [Lepeophtheirus salmonis]CAF2955900.1 STOM [Lepeophtheirus salmonis]
MSTLTIDEERNEESSCVNSFASILLTSLATILVIITFPISLFFAVRQVKEYERAVIFRVDEIQVVDLRTISFDVPPQEILTKDSVTVAVDAVIYYKINNPLASVCNVSNAPSSTRLLASTTLRTTLGTKSLADILSDREHIAHDLLQQLDEATDPWGIKVERVEMKDVRLPQQLQRAMATEAEAMREAKAKVIAAEGEQKASRALKEASDILSDSKSALQLRYLQTLTHISAEKNSTIIFPLPIDLIQGLLPGNKNTSPV